MGAACMGPLERRLVCFLAVDHPRNTELVDQHTEAVSPERLFKRHHYFSIGRQSLEYTLCLRRIIDREIEEDALRLLEVFGRNVRTHQYGIPDAHPGMNDLLAPLRWYVAGGR